MELLLESGPTLLQSHLKEADMSLNTHKEQCHFYTFTLQSGATFSMVLGRYNRRKGGS